MSLLVYALAGRRSDGSRMSGVCGERLRIIPIAGLAAVVGEVAAAPSPTARNLREFDRVVRVLWQRNSALLPARFGTVMPDRVELEQIVRVRRQMLRRQLAIVRNRAQMTIRVVEGERGQGGRGQGAQTGTHYLRARARLYDVPAFAPVRAAVRRWIRAERVERRGAIATVYHLVPRSAVTRYRKRLERVAAIANVRVHVSGPWPAYAFADGW